MKTLSGRPWITDDVDYYWPQDGGLDTSPELYEELKHRGFGGPGPAEMKIYQAVHVVEHSIRSKRVGNRARVAVGDRLVSIRREPEGWVMTKHVKKPKSWIGG